MQTPRPSFVLSLPEIMLLSVTRCKKKECGGTCMECKMSDSVAHEACLNLPSPPFATSAPPLFELFFPFHGKKKVNILAILSGYIYIMRYAAMMKELPMHKDAKERADMLESANTERAKQWGAEGTKTALAACMFFELRLMYTMAVFDVVSKGSPDSSVETVFQKLVIGWLSAKMDAEQDTTPQGSAYMDMYNSICKELDQDKIVD